MDYLILIGIASILSVILTKTYDFLIKRHQEKRLKDTEHVEQEIEEQKFMYNTYVKKFIDGLTENVKDMKVEIKQLQQDHLECRIENASLKQRVFELEKKYGHLNGGR